MFFLTSRLPKIPMKSQQSQQSELAIFQFNSQRLVFLGFGGGRFGVQLFEDFQDFPAKKTILIMKSPSIQMYPNHPQVSGQIIIFHQPGFP